MKRVLVELVLFAMAALAMLVAFEFAGFSQFVWSVVEFTKGHIVAEVATVAVVAAVAVVSRPPRIYAR